MSFAGIYDSGIGGLTTLFALKKAFGPWDFYYLADTLSNPLGTKTYPEIVKTVSDGIDILKRHSRIQVVACNTASTVVKPKGAYLLRPDLDALPSETTLILSTPATERALKLKEKGYGVAETKNLATAVEILCETAFNSRDITVINNLEGGLKSIVDEGMKGRKIERIYLGCSHYLYFKSILKRLYPNVEIVDGNDRLIDEIRLANFTSNGQGEITFDFTLGNQSRKYEWLLAQMKEHPEILDI